jgi:O-antigen ligase
MMWPKLWSWPFGHGPNTSGHTLGYIDATGLLTVDSYYITVLLEYGIAGFVIYYSVFLLTAGQLTRMVLQGPTRKPSLAVPVAISMIVFVIDKSVLSLQNNHSIIFMILGMAFALRYRMNSEAATSASPRGSARSPFLKPINA